MIEQGPCNCIYSVVQYHLILLLVLSALGSNNSYPNYLPGPALGLSRHLWNDRVLLIFSEDDKSDNYIAQLNTLLNNKKDMAERKLVYYTISRSYYKYLNNPAIESDQPWKKYRKSDTLFSVQLIGLDGGMKVHRNSVIMADELFAIIDGMPMRRSELRRKKNK